MGKLKATTTTPEQIAATESLAITAANYAERAQAFIRARGGVGFVIRAPGCREGRATPAQWHAWTEYLARIGVKTTFMRQHGVATVPSEWPEQFDMTAPSSDPLWAPTQEPAKDSLTVEQRHANVARFRRMLTQPQRRAAE